MANNTAIIQGAVTDEVIQPTWGTLDGAGNEGGSGINIDKIITDISALLADRFYTKEEIDAGYYTKDDVDDTFYKKIEIDSLFYTKEETDDIFYNKTEIDSSFYTKEESDDIYPKLSGENLSDLTNQTSWRDALGAVNGVWPGGICGIEDSGWLSLTDTSKHTGNILYRKVGKIVYISLPEITLTEARDSSGWTTLNTLPNGFCPTIMGISTGINTRGSSVIGILYINTIGEIRITAISGQTIQTNYSLYRTICFPV